MSDFLEKLAARSLGLTTVIRPRLPSRFESSPTTGDAARGFDVKSLESESEVESSEGGERSILAAKWETFAAPSERHSRAKDSSSSFIHPPTESGGDDTDAEPERTEAALPPASFTTESPRTIFADPPSHSPAQMNVTRYDERMFPDAEDVSPHLTNTAATEPNKTFAARKNERADEFALQNLVPAIDNHEDAMREEQKPHLETDKRLVTPPVIVPRPITSLIDESAVITDVAPTIKVTINRIEVRAVTTPPLRPHVAAPARPQPTLSLRDYLKQRDEKGRL